jgi:ABC-type amino acid transport system permease subunit
VCKIYLTVIRGTPVVIQLLIIYFVIFGKIDINKVLAAVIAFGFNSGAYVAEIVRSGIMSIDYGQLEAGRSLGFSYAKTMWLIILPQAFKNVLPALGNEFIVLVKETSIVSFVGTADLYKAFNDIGTNSYEFMVPYIVMALIYIVLVLAITIMVKALERRLGKSDRRN